MGEVKHTPGPWAAFKLGSSVGVTPIDGNRMDVAQCDGFDSFRSSDETMANANLIAAAPDMLAALQFASGYIEGQIATEAAGLASPPAHWETLVETINAAIARAEGRS